MKLYYAPGACSMADHIALIENGLPYDLVKVDLKAKQTEDGRDFNQINPKGYVPALELADGAILTENIAILSYVADKGGALLPKDGLARYRAIEAVAFVSGEIHKNFGPLFNPRTSEAERDDAKAALARRYATIEAAVAQHGYAAGDAMSIADCYLLVTLLWAKKFGLPTGETLEAYRDRLLTRPSVQRAMVEEGLA